jgi:hypothetical protein
MRSRLCPFCETPPARAALWLPAYLNPLSLVSAGGRETGISASFRHNVSGAGPYQGLQSC